MCDPHARLIRLIDERAGTGAVLTRAEATPWRTATFTGERHLITYRADEDAAARLLAMREESFHIPRHILADLDVRHRRDAGGDRHVVVAALTLESG